MNNDPTTLIIMAAGLGSRFGGSKQAEILNPNGNTIMDYSIYDAIQAGFQKVIFIIHPNMDPEFSLFKMPDYENSIEVQVVTQQLRNLPEGFSLPNGRKKPWGTGHALLSAIDQIDSPFAVINADDFYGRHAFIQMAKFLSSDAPEDYAMVAYPISKTLSNFGSVSRGICKINKQAQLQSIVEWKHIISQDGIIKADENSQDLILDPNTLVSMNFWGFKSEFMPQLSAGFTKFLANMSNPLMDEYFLPSAVNDLVSHQLKTVKVFNSDDQWFGLTYREDKEIVKENIDSLTKENIYPSILF